MTSTTSTTTPGTRTARGRVRSLALVLSAAAAASAASVALGPLAAQAEPGDTLVALGSSQLLQSEDLAAIQVPLDTESVVVGRNPFFSACVGEGRWSDVVPGARTSVQAAWSSRRDENQWLFETVGQARTAARAKSDAAKLVRAGIRNCQGSAAPFDFHFGPTTSGRVGSGYATWAPSYRGDATRPDGGVIVFRKGTNVGIIDVTGSWGPNGQMLESLAKVAVHRLR